jgi:hypothetical protein
MKHKTANKERGTKKNGFLRCPYQDALKRILGASPPTKVATKKAKKK